MLVDAMEKFSRPELRAVPCDQSTLAAVRAQWAETEAELANYIRGLSAADLDRILESSQRASLVAACLDTLHRFLNWIPLGYIFETKLIETLIYKVRICPSLFAAVKLPARVER